MHTSAPIGIFDSGLGGLTVWKEVVTCMPQESTIYLADSINAPYGNKSKEEIQSLVRKNIKVLLERGAKIVIMACNTASTQAADLMREEFEIPIVALEPAIKPAALYSKNHKVGVLATKGTLKSEKFLNTSSLFRENTKIYEVIGQGLVEAVENNTYQSEESQKLLFTYSDQLDAEGIDALVLGCTHYPFYRSILEAKYPHIKIFDSGRAIALRTQDILSNLEQLAPSGQQATHHLYSNGDVKMMTKVLKDTPMPNQTTIQALDF